ncbi:MAG: tetratricopeptide repeat protein [Sandarakinorhabdus sp.]|nr:tetratricopeptide repeat protein [Sandarakinorhabdus sp.]
MKARPKRTLTLVLVAALLAPLPLEARQPGPASAAPDSLTPVLARAAARSGQWEAAARLWRKATLENSADPIAWAQLGEALSRIGEPASAVAALSRATALNSRDPGIALSLGRAQLAQGHGKAAVAAFTSATARNPADPRGWTGLGVAQDLVGNHAAAQQAYARALGIDPLNRAARHNLALSLAIRMPEPAATP